MHSRLVLCLDGTWNSPFKPVTRDDGSKVLKPTNPLKLARAVRPVDDAGARQLTYYDSGIGALGVYPGKSNAILSFFDSKLGGMFGAGFEANVEEAASFLALNYTPGDHVFVFGFSRGAAQARALSNFLSWMGGIPPKDDAYYVPLFFRHYLKARGNGAPSDVKNSDGTTPAAQILPLYTTLLGVWDTVMALGSRLNATAGTSVKGRAFHIKARPAPIVRHAYQALAIDEKRYDFRPEVWLGAETGQTLKQRWFPGAHGNVGGSYRYDGLANGTLHWIAEAASALGLALDTRFLQNYRPFAQDHLGDTHDLFYRVGEAARFMLGKGARAMNDYPDAANLDIDASVIKRFASDHNKFPRMDGPYRPAPVVERLEQERNRWPEFLSEFKLDPDTYPFPSDV
ncbi:MAG: DUF2235 domain-containing protein [Boseongicola sp. SB0662_bin_57]|nr:DUF2235 domain-containing protein [Boseongicola sp. SB0662_bin_57]